MIEGEQRERCHAEHVDLCCRCREFAAASGGIAPDLVKKLAPLCQPMAPKLVKDSSDKPVSGQKLNELPNANAYLTVLRKDEHGCDKPAIVAYDIGSAPHRAGRSPQR